MSVDIGRKKNKNKKRTNDNDAGNPNIFCSQFGGRKDTEHCTSLKYAKKSARKFDLTPKEGFFYNYSEHRNVGLHHFRTFFVHFMFIFVHFCTFFVRFTAMISTGKVINGR